jgi:hypothetical protein
MEQERKLIGFIDLSGKGPIFRPPTAAEARAHKAQQAAKARKAKQQGGK